jgi:hypothetical protein
MSSSRAAAWMFARVVVSRLTFSGPTVLTIVASTSAVAAMFTMFSGVFGAAFRDDFGSPLLCANAFCVTPSSPMPPSVAAAPATSCRRVAAGRSRCCSSIVSYTSSRNCVMDSPGG